MRVISVVGARPQFVKLAAVEKGLADSGLCEGIDHLVVHTGQHFDAGMSEVFFTDLAIPEPAVNLGIGGGGHGEQTGRMLVGLEEVFINLRPDWVLVYGDTNSTLAAAIAAVKLHIPVAHLEAGLRSFNRRMPEEHNRVLTDHASDLLLAPTENAMRLLANEGLADRAVLVGDVMTDICLAVSRANEAAPPPLPGGLPLAGPFVLATLHRAENTDDGQRISELIAALASLPDPVVLAVHPRLRSRSTEFGVSLDQGSLHPIDPLPYPLMVELTRRASMVVTDSGGLQKEAFILGTPCTTARTESEWPETLEAGWNVLAPSASDVAAAAVRPLPTAPRRGAFGDGHAGRRVWETLRSQQPPA